MTTPKEYCTAVYEAECDELVTRIIAACEEACPGDAPAARVPLIGAALMTAAQVLNAMPVETRFIKPGGVASNLAWLLAHKVPKP